MDPHCFDADPNPDPDPGGGRKGVGQPKMCITPGKILGTPLVASYYSESAQYWYHAKKVGIVSAHSMEACTGRAVRQVVFTDVQVTIRQRAAVLQVLRALLLLVRTKQMLPLIGCS